MAEVYSGAYLTIAATGALSSTSGCLFTRWHETDLGVNIPHAVSKHQSDRVSALHGVKARYVSKAHTHLEKHLSPPGSGATLSTRPWAFQERVLSHRLIYFHGEEMVWQCREIRECECGYFAWDLAINPRENPSTLLAKDGIEIASFVPEAQLETFKKWLGNVKEFTKLEIRYELDRLPTISGIAKSFQGKLGSSYTAGVWEYRLGHGLLWKKMPFQSSRRITGTRDQYIPSWSWASVELLSKRFFGLSTYARDITIDKHFCAKSLPSSNSIKSILDIQDASLQVEGLVISCNFTHQHAVKSEFSPTHRILFRGETESVYTDITCDDKATLEEVEVTCLLLGATSDKDMLSWDVNDSSSCLVQYAVVLQLEAAGNYTRVGICEHDSRKGWFDDAIVTRITIL